jgi:hypothetical protein
MAPIPEPKPGLLFRYGYLWLEERKSGRIDPSKDRPACIVARVTDTTTNLQVIGGNLEPSDVIIFPITTRPPRYGSIGVELGADEKRQCGLQPELPSWVIVSEFNADIWPNADISLIPGRDRFDYGVARPSLMRRIGNKFAEARRTIKVLGIKR